MLDPWIAWYVQLLVAGMAMVLTINWAFGRGKAAGMKFLQPIVFMFDNDDQKTTERYWYAVPRVGDAVRLIFDEEPVLLTVVEVKWSDDDEKVYVRLA